MHRWVLVAGQVYLSAEAIPAPPSQTTAVEAGIRFNDARQEQI